MGISTTITFVSLEIGDLTCVMVRDDVALLGNQMYRTMARTKKTLDVVAELNVTCHVDVFCVGPWISVLFNR